jgi:hypothetical protein
MTQSMHHYFLISGEITFLESGIPETNVMRANALMRSPRDTITVAQLREAQERLRYTFAAHVGKEASEKLTLLDITILSISPLGAMSEEEFNAGVEDPSHAH